MNLLFSTILTSNLWTLVSKNRKVIGVRCYSSWFLLHVICSSSHFLQEWLVCWTVCVWWFFNVHTYNHSMLWHLMMLLTLAVLQWRLIYYFLYRVHVDVLRNIAVFTPFNTKTMTLFLVCVSSIVLSIVIAETQKKLKIHEAPRIAPFLTLSSLLWHPCKRYPCWSLGELQFKPSFSTFHVKLTTHIPKYCSNSLDFLVLIILWSCCSTVTSLLTVWYILLMLMWCFRLYVLQMRTWQISCPAYFQCLGTLL